MSKSDFDIGRLSALIRKETIQMVRDPSTILIAFILPIILLVLFAYAVSLDIKNLPIAVVRQSDSVKAQSMAAAYSGTKFFKVRPMRDLRAASDAMKANHIRGIVVIPQNFDNRTSNPRLGPLVEIIADGAQPNTARFTGNAALAVAQGWVMQNSAKTRMTALPQIEIIPRYWFNADMETRLNLIPGSIAIIMTMIGTLLTSMVVAREWERGTMEAMMATPANVAEILIGKLLPYFGIGMLATIICGLFAIVILEVPLRGTWLGLIAVSAAFLVPALGQGLLISAATKNQFAAAQLSLFSGFLPAMMFSGFIYEVSSMPFPLRIISALFPATYYVQSLRTIFLVGDVWKILLPDIIIILLIGAFFFIQSARNTSKTLDGK